ncbi:MAG: transcription antitermination factor NusB [Endomicrobia bacterium]|nr:transcription antitermination factor NusB [Endomicrobiia bacterium]
MVQTHKKHIGIRRKSRLLALNVLYLIDVGNLSIETAINFVFDQSHNFAEGIKRFSSFLVIATLQNLDIIDELIKKHLENWTIERLSAIDRNLLRLATSEFICCPETPVSVIINEAIEIAKEYSTKDSGRFVNGLLDKIKLVREDKDFIKRFTQPQRPEDLFC